ncbi:MAG TPA: 3'(2'),5'-bisphosphate nucleotidase CysQ [Xanthobacteraceae bacterium]|nr:3'(2'),5'-bisphosphate nucleotidase CysQ [Xanthobacteraceae bacterium]
MSAGEYARLLEPLARLAATAGQRILATAPRDLDVRPKADRSPVTIADEASEAILHEGLARILPGVPVIAEESVAAGDRPEPGREFLLVDPLDGTREFLDGRPEYAVNIALVSNGVPVIGLIYAPAQGILYAGGGSEAVRASIPPGGELDRAKAATICARPRPNSLVVAVSRSHPDPATEKFVASLTVERRLIMGSSLKFAAIAEGAADVYPRFAPISEWDVAAGHALVAAAGGSMKTPDGNAITYGARARHFRLDGFIAWGGPPAG